MNLSPHFTLEEFTHSDTALRMGIQNIASPNIIGNLKLVAEGLEQVRKLLGTPIFVTSGYRSPTLNRAIGSGNTSDHLLGFAADFKSPAFGSPDDIVRKIIASDIKFHQCICEGFWVHLSFNPKLERQALRALFDNKGKATYRAFV